MFKISFRIQLALVISNYYNFDELGTVGRITCSHELFDNCMDKALVDTMRKVTEDNCTIPIVMDNSKICTKPEDIKKAFFIARTRMLNEANDCDFSCKTLLIMSHAVGGNHGQHGKSNGDNMANHGNPTMNDMANMGNHGQSSEKMMENLMETQGNLPMDSMKNHMGNLVKSPSDDLANNMGHHGNQQAKNMAVSMATHGSSPKEEIKSRMRNPENPTSKNAIDMRKRANQGMKVGDGHNLSSAMSMMKEMDDSKQASGLKSGKTERNEHVILLFPPKIKMIKEHQLYSILNLVAEAGNRYMLL